MGFQGMPAQHKYEWSNTALFSLPLIQHVHTDAEATAGGLGSMCMDLSEIRSSWARTDNAKRQSTVFFFSYLPYMIAFRQR